MRTLADWLDYITVLHQKKIDLGLARVEKIAQQLHLKHFPCPVITVAGTNGKGSVTTCLEHIYAAAGLKTGLYTSPHLLRFHERIRINQQEVNDAALVAAFEAIDTARDLSLSFFEFTTLAALLLFQQAKLDVLILEVGLGGRLDAVNVVENDLAIVTSIDLDHMEFLGHTRDAIAFEKASIARANKPFISGDENPPAQLFKTISEKRARLFQIKKDFDYRVTDSCLHCFGKNFEFTLSPLPNIKPQNIAISIMAAICLQAILPVSEEAILQGVRQTMLPGRFEKITQPMPCILDVAHNPQASTWLSTQYQRLPPVQKSIALVGMLKDKAIPETIQPLLPFFDEWYVAKLSDERGSDGMVAIEFLKSRGVDQLQLFESVSIALDAMRHAYYQQKWDRALIFGSFHTIANAKLYLKETISGR